MSKASNGMMGNKWLHGALIYGFGLGLFVGPIISALFGPYGMIAAMAILFFAMWKLGNIRGTDGWGGPYYGPIESAERAEQLKSKE